MSIHYITDILSLLIGFRVYLYLNKDKSLDNLGDLWYVISGAIGALFFSRLIAALEYPDLFFHAQSFLYYYENKTIIGAIVGGIIGVEIYKYFNNIKRNTGDAVTIALIIGIIIGRIGCQLKGISDGTIGVPCDYLWCLRAGDEFTRHPLPLYEIVYLLFLLPIVYYLSYIKKFAEGLTFRLFIILYFSLRFYLETLKDIHPIISNLSIIQLVCLVFIIYYIYDIIRHGLYNPVKAKL